MTPRALFVTDLDRTLLAEDRSIPARNVAAIRDAAGRGVVTAIVTGRRRSSVDGALGALAGVPFRLATSNGAVVLGADNRAAEAVHPIDWSIADAIAADPALDHAPVLCIVAPDDAAGGSPFDCFVREPGARRWLTSLTPYDVASLAETDPTEARRRPLVHIALRLDTREQADAVAARLRPSLPETASTHVVRSPLGPGALTEVVPTGGKGLALTHLAVSLGIALEATAAIGDELNDADLLDAARHRYAVGGTVLARARRDAIEVAPAEDGAVADGLARFLAAAQL